MMNWLIDWLVSGDFTPLLIVGGRDVLKIVPVGPLSYLSNEQVREVSVSQRWTFSLIEIVWFQKDNFG